MIFIRAGLPVVVFGTWEAGLPSGAWRDGASLPTFTAIFFGETEHR